MYLSTCQQELFSGLVFGAKKKKKRVWQHDRRFGAYLQTYTYAICNPSSEEQVKQIQCLKNKKLSVSVDNIGAFTHHSGYFCLVVYSYQASLNLLTPVNVCGCPRTDQKLLGLALLHFYLLYFLYTSYILHLFEQLFPAAFIYV